MSLLRRLWFDMPKDK
ncbi:hypothetical protein KIPB_016487, partial [Kipferlia bialata]|eukprot:g16487.t1